jgi:hypothetical protein
MLLPVMGGSETFSMDCKFLGFWWLALTVSQLLLKSGSVVGIIQ